MSPRRRRPIPALDRLSTVERGDLLTHLLASHPELLAEGEQWARSRLAFVDADEVAGSVAWALRDADINQLAQRSGRVRGRGYVHEGEAAGEILEELLQPDLDDLARRADLGLDDAARQIGLGLLRGLVRCRTAVNDGTVLAYGGSEVIDDLASSVVDALSKAGLTLPDDALGELPLAWGR